MTNQLEKLKNSIKKEYLKSFELNLMKTSGFIPVDKRQGEFFVILNKRNVLNKSEVETIIKEKFEGLTPKFIPIEAVDFDALFENISNLQNDEKKEVAVQEEQK